MDGARERMAEAAADCAAMPLSTMATDDLIEHLRGLHEVESTLRAAKAHAVHQLESRDIAKTHQATSMVVWLRDVLRLDGHVARRLVELARALHRHPAIDAATSTGRIDPDQAAVIAEAVNELPAEIGPELTAEAEKALIERAATFEPVSLRKIGVRILDHIAPDVAERIEALVLARQEARARAGRTFTLASFGDGRSRLSGWLPTDAAAAVAAAIDPLSRPTGRDDDRTAGQRRADALVELCERTARGTGDTVAGNGPLPEVVVTTSYDVLHGRLRAGSLDNGDRLSAEQVRRMACDARIIPAVLGSAGQVLDVGQATRVISAPLRRAVHLRDRSCAFPGCDRPPGWAEIHHVIHWSCGGPTCLGNLVLLCRYHHRCVHHDSMHHDSMHHDSMHHDSMHHDSMHHDGWSVRIAADGLPEFIPPRHIDPQQRPRRNKYHRRL